MSERVITMASPRSVPDTVNRLTEMVGGKRIKVFAVIDHSGEAEHAGQQLRDTKLVVFGSPKAGTPVTVLVCPGDGIASAGVLSASSSRVAEAAAASRAVCACSTQRRRAALPRAWALVRCMRLWRSGRGRWCSAESAAGPAAMASSRR